MHTLRLAAAALLATATPVTAQAQADSTESRPPVPVSLYPLMPTPVMEWRTLTTGLALSGYISVRETYRNDSSTFALNRARLTIATAPRHGLGIRLQVDFAGAGRLGRDSTVPAMALTDAYVQLGRVPRTARDSSSRLARLAPVLIAGQFRVPFSLEYLTPFSLLRTANRSLVVDRISPRRDIGAMVQWRFGGVASLAGALVNGSGPNQPRNPDGVQLVTGRLAVRPGRALAVAGKWGGEGPDHYWGYDARWLSRVLTVEGEVVHRRGRQPGAGSPTTGYVASGGYALLAVRPRPWLEPVVKWEQYQENTAAHPSETWTTYGITFRAPDERVRLQANWIVKHTHPVARPASELIAQLIATY